MGAFSELDIILSEIYEEEGRDPDKVLARLPCSFRVKGRDVVVGKDMFLEWLVDKVRQSAMERMKEAYAEIARRQKGRCTLCHLELGAEIEYQFDHAMPVADGGEDCFSNLQAVHKTCCEMRTTL